MMYETGVVDNLLDVGNKFIEFAQKSNNTTNAWKLEQDKIESFHGSTLKISDSLYVSLMHRRVDKDTYAHWLRDMEDYGSELYDKTESTKEVSCTYITKHGLPNRENMVRNTGYFLSVGTHKLFDPDLWMFEQGGIICSTETDEQINRANLIEIHKIVQEGNKRPVDSFVVAPSYPTTGCPWLIS